MKSNVKSNVKSDTSVKSDVKSEVKSDISLHKMSLEERVNFLKKELNLSDEDAKSLSSSLDLNDADKLIENVIGNYSLPLGIATNFIVNGKEIFIPMVIEESSVVAAASNAAKYARETGGFKAEFSENITVGQIQLVGIEDKETDQIKKQILEKKDEIMKIANDLNPSMVKRGGGCKNLTVENFKTKRGNFIVIYIYFNTCDAMGANTINTICEKLAPFLSDLTGKQYRLRILSNYAIEKLAKATAVFKKETVSEEVIEGILDGYELAKVDIRRAVTHNKGIMNGIDAVGIATGNDWRAIESGAHAYAARNGKYQPLTYWEKNKNGDLVGKIEIPLQIGTVGGIISVHPIPKLSLKIMGVNSVKELAEIMASVGLANNFAALKALASEGIQAGHMKLHAINLVISAGAEGEIAERIAKKMIEENNISMERARELLNENY